METLDLQHNWVLVTGASSGLGLEMAKQLARNKSANLVLVARRQSLLESLKAEIEAESSSECLIIAADLSREEEVYRVFQEACEGREIKAVILNAGVTYFGKDQELDWDYFKAMQALNVNSVVLMGRLFINYFRENNSDGALLFVLSMAGLTPVPYQAAYSGTKAFLNHYVQALSQELRREKFSLGIFAPGGIATEMNTLSGLDQYFSEGLFLQPVDECAAEAIETLINRKYLFVPRIFNRIQLFLTRLASRRFNALTAARSYENAMKQGSEEDKNKSA